MGKFCLSIQLNQLRKFPSVLTLKPARKLIITKRDTAYSIFDAACPHSNGPLHKGVIDIEDVITCPWHEFKFDTKSGKGLSSDLFDLEMIEFKLTNSSLDLFIDNEYTVESIDEFKNNHSCEDVPSLTALTINEASLNDEIINILLTPNPTKKVERTHQLFANWKNGSLKFENTLLPIPDKPARESMLNYIDPRKMKRLGKGGNVESRIAILHSLANIEQWAIDLALDIIVRFSPEIDDGVRNEFISDFLKIATEECKHFSLLSTRLEELGSFYGSHQVHGALWESAEETMHSLICRLGIVHMVHEARGLDVNPSTIQKFNKGKDNQSVKILEEIHHDEIGHVTIAQKWFAILHQELNCECIVEKEIPNDEKRYEYFHQIVRKHYHGILKPPFNHEDRLMAGLDENYYLPLSIKS